MPKTIRVKLGKHFKVAVQYKDVVSFENELNNKGLDFYLNCKDESSQCSLVSYYLFEKDRSAVDDLLQENEIVANYETLQFANLSEQKNFMGLYIKLVGVFIVLLVMLKVVDAIVKP
ncbi:hypothetical protein FEDK69T_23310 [Flavobacterium enshiense DK69]|uniref:Uncharacterized protein n=1 Tax=Flavobacterium enshiense DK69 TaxID=1107311 RepID=V6S7V9_9FLAO|nr:hypothetical protein [Flavobacterium enshiense]ESU22347.1 hypothetical protein FEDK69T_23310 [Flavobacterium enshiense DK69]KGO97349.1 hypothetical protein Q767_01760 [Flavobacterium enshiense DK69]